MAHLFSRRQERHQVLSRIGAALRDVRQKYPGKDVPVSWHYGQDTAERSTEETIALFIKRCEDYKASVARIHAESVLPAAIAAAADRMQLQSIVVPPGLDATWLDILLTSSTKVLLDSPPLSKKELDEVDGVLTASAVAIAETGTIVLDHSASQGRRIITLLPTCHICVVYAADIVGSVPEGIQRLKPAMVSGSPVTWISGPSATVDIEFTRVEGVHGPHKLFVLVIG